MQTPPTVRVETIIPAARQAVWDVLVDFARYPEWNPFTVRGMLLDCTRVQELEELGERETRYVCHESFRCLSVPLFFKRYERPMQDGFEAAAQALARRVLQLQAAGAAHASSERLA